MKVIKSLCGMCPIACGIDVYVKDGKVIKVAGMEEHVVRPVCVKAKGIIDWVYSSERITNPLKKINSRWKEISWDEAFTFISDKLLDVKEKYGPKALVVHLGYQAIATQVTRLARRFCDLYGTPNFTTGASFCYLARAIAYSATFNHNFIWLMPAPLGTRCMVAWGTNPTQSFPMVASMIFQAKESGAKLIVVDPRRTHLAKIADIHAQLRPGTDCALALGLLNVIVEEGLYDRQFVEDWTHGFERLIEHLREYTPERVEQITWVPASTIRGFARTYAESKPACIFPGVSVDHCTNGIQAHRAISTLIAITHNFDIPGGSQYVEPLPQADLGIRERISLEEAIGAEYPLFSKFLSETTVVTALDAMIKGKPYPIKSLIVQACNPALTWPNAGKIKRAFEKLDLIVVIDHFMTETAKLADLILPATTFLERKDILDYAVLGFPLVGFRDKAIEPFGNCMPDWKIWSKLGEKMGYEEYFPWEGVEELFETLLEPTNVTVGKLKENPRGVFYRPVERERYLKCGFNTPSGKVEIYSEMMERYGYDPLPTYREPAESPVSKSDLARKYPLILTTGVRVNVFTHSQHRDIPKLRKEVPEPLVEVNAQTAEGLGITDGDVVRVESPRGSIELKVKVTEDIDPRVVNLQHGWAEANANILTDDEKRDPVSGYPGFRSLLCRVIKA
jgi:anaerobic selenocysteine-containing dehydrogenase